MRLAYLTTDLGIPVFGEKGASVHVRSITSALSVIGHDVCLLATNFNGDNRKDDALTYYRIGNHKKAKNNWKWAKKCLLAATHPRLENGDDPAGIEPDFSEINEIIALEVVGNCSIEGTAILEDYRPDIIIERLSPFGTAGMIISRNLKLPRIVEMNSPLSEEAKKWRRLHLHRLSQSLEDACLSSADGVIVVSEELKKRLARASLCEDQILVLPNGVESEQFFPMEKERKLLNTLGLEKKFVIGFSGSLKKWHGVENLIHAFSGLAPDYPDMVLLIVGDGPEINGLKNLAGMRHLSERIIFTGNVPYSEMPLYLSLFDIAAAPYAAEKNFYFSPLKVIEYLSCGIPTIATETGEMAKMFKSGENGLLIPSNTPDDIMAGITRLYKNPGLHEVIAGNSASLALGRSWRDNAGKIIEFAEKIISKGRFSQ
jgi:glycosyltransferase involved in cell wall biosynthesis